MINFSLEDGWRLFAAFLLIHRCKLQRVRDIPVLSEYIVLLRSVRIAVLSVSG